ncbi:MAG: hypothetical protein DSY42_08075 [Aquifex sp.]|nr:MAG: hypothetical protein DSY42_08075 [Aquifex sp.]
MDKIKLEGIFKDFSVIGFEVLRKGDNNEEFFLFIDEKTDFELFVENLKASYNLPGIIFLNIKPCTLLEFHTQISKLIKPNFVLEIREDFVCSDALKELKKIKEIYNFRIAIDDFGKSFSNTQRFLILRPEFVKIDIKDFSETEIANFVSFFKKARTIAIAEKVESLHEFLLIKKLGFDLWQGFFEKYLNTSVNFLHEKFNTKESS